MPLTQALLASYFQQLMAVASPPVQAALAFLDHEERAILQRFYL